MRAPQLDLVALVADADQQEVVIALLTERSESLGIDKLRYKVLKHPRRDAGCFHEGAELLQPFVSLSKASLVMFDHEGSGQDSRDPTEVAADVRGLLSKAGWGDRAEVIVIVPELEAWVWSDSPHVSDVLGWKGAKQRLRDWLADKGHWPRGSAKPPRPKESLEAVLQETKRRRSPAIYGKLARTVSVERCEDLAFGKLKDFLLRLFAKGRVG